MAKSRDTYKYQFKVGNKVVHGGITKDLDRREQEHQQTWPKGHIVQVGHRTTEDTARKWEKVSTRNSALRSPPIRGSRKLPEYERAARAVLIGKGRFKDEEVQKRGRVKKR